MSTADTTLRRIRNTTATLAAGLFTWRCAVGLDILHAPEAVRFAALFPFLACLVTAGVTGYRVKVRKLERRANLAEWEAALARREQRSLEAEERSWWAEPIDEDTAAFGPNVRVFPAHRRPHPQAG